MSTNDFYFQDYFSEFRSFSPVYQRTQRTAWTNEEISRFFVPVTGILARELEKRNDNYIKELFRRVSVDEID